MASTSSDVQLLTEHFGYPPISLFDDIINSINILAERALNSVEQGLLNASPATIGFKASSSSPADYDPVEAARTEVESGTHQLETLLFASIDRTFDKFELYMLRNVFCVQPPDIRNYMRLSHYDGLDFSSIPSKEAPDGHDDHGSSSDRPTLESVTQLRQRLRESMRLNALLHAEQARNARMLADLGRLLGVKVAETAAGIKPEPREGDGVRNGPLAFLHQQVAQLKDAGADTPLTTTTAFTLSQLQAVRTLSTALRTMLPDLAPPRREEGDGAGAAAQGRKTWRRERLEYVEGATRRHMERVQGLELGKEGEVRDDEWQGQGKTLAKGEVEALEGVVAALEGGRTAGPVVAATGTNGDKADEMVDEDADEDADPDTVMQDS